MTLPLAGFNLLAWTLQTFLLLLCGLALPELLRVGAPSVRLAYWRLLFLAVIVIPLSQLFFSPAPVSPPKAVPYLLSGIAVEVSPAASSASNLYWPLVAVWGAGSIVLFARWSVGLLRLGRLLKDARPLPASVSVPDTQWRALRRRPAILLSDCVSGPVTFGWRHPAVLLPGDFAAMPREARLTIMTHEFRHVARRDWLWLLGEEAVAVLFWFHPAVWLIRPRIALAREEAVDLEVVRLTGERKPYMQALSAMARRRQGAAAVGSLPFQRRSHLLQRMTLLAQEKHMSKGRMAVTAAALFLALSFAGLVAARAFPLRGDGGGSHAKTAKEQEKIYPMSARKTMAKVLNRVNPAYPEKLKKEGKGGVVVLRVVIGKNGHIESMEVLKSNDPLFSKAAKEAVSQWVYQPVNVHGKIVRAYQIVQIRFLPHNAKKKAPEKTGKNS